MTNQSFARQIDTVFWCFFWHYDSFSRPILISLMFHGWLLKIPSFCHSSSCIPTPNSISLSARLVLFFNGYIDKNNFDRAILCFRLQDNHKAFPQNKHWTRLPLSYIILLNYVAKLNFFVVITEVLQQIGAVIGWIIPNLILYKFLSVKIWNRSRKYHSSNPSKKHAARLSRG